MSFHNEYCYWPHPCEGIFLIFQKYHSLRKYDFVVHCQAEAYFHWNVGVKKKKSNAMKVQLHYACPTKSYFCCVVFWVQKKYTAKSCFWCCNKGLKKKVTETRFRFIEYTLNCISITFFYTLILQKQKVDSVYIQ